MKRILLATLAILLTACLSPSGGAPQTAEPTPTATTLPTATATISPTPTSTQTPQPTPTPDVSVMTDEEKIALVEGYDAEIKFTSTVFPSIVIIDDGSSYLAYDIQTGEVKRLAEAGIAVLTTKTGEKLDFEAYTIDDVREAIEADNPYLNFDEYVSEDQRKEKADLYASLYRISSIDYTPGYRLGFSCENSETGEDYGVFVLGIKNSDGSLGSLIIYSDSNAKYKVVYVYSDAKTIEGRLGKPFLFPRP
jgi:hypothetical protein